jgi:hypothetical protein
MDAIRTDLDMLPGNPVSKLGVGRTDGTGWPGTTPMPMVGWDGGTTPVCALAPFGHRLDSSVPYLLRMNIDVESDLQPNSPIAILVDRPPEIGTSGISALQLGQPGNPGPQLLVGGQEIYTTNAPIWYPAVWTAGRSLRFPMGTLPGGGWAFTVQMVFGVYPGIPAGVAGSCAGATQLAATPALWVAY